MDPELEKLFDEAIQLELNVSKLYILFHDTFREDANFWWTLVLEEKDHAALINSIKTVGHFFGEYPRDIVPQRFEDLIEVNKNVINIIQEFEKNPDRKKAFLIAIELEKSAGELHCQTFLETISRSSKYKILQQLYKDDVDHAERIQRYMEENNI